MKCEGSLFKMDVHDGRRFAPASPLPLVQKHKKRITSLRSVIPFTLSAKA
jgi:hypothetical protein